MPKFSGSRHEGSLYCLRLGVRCAVPEACHWQWHAPRPLPGMRATRRKTPGFQGRMPPSSLPGSRRCSCSVRNIQLGSARARGVAAFTGRSPSPSLVRVRVGWPTHCQWADQLSTVESARAVWRCHRARLSQGLPLNGPVYTGTRGPAKALKGGSVTKFNAAAHLRRVGDLALARRCRRFAP